MKAYWENFKGFALWGALLLAAVGAAFAWYNSTSPAPWETKVHVATLMALNAGAGLYLLYQAVMNICVSGSSSRTWMVAPFLVAVAGGFAIWRVWKRIPEPDTTSRVLLTILISTAVVLMVPIAKRVLAQDCVNLRNPRTRLSI